MYATSSLGRSRLFLISMLMKSLIFLHDMLLAGSVSAYSSSFASGLVVPLDRPRPSRYCSRFLSWVGASTTVISKLFEVLLPAASDAVHLTVLSPIGNLLPDSRMQTRDVTATLSFAEKE